jgi:hypothetical protein
MLGIAGPILGLISESCPPGGASSSPIVTSDRIEVCAWFQAGRVMRRSWETTSFLWIKRYARKFDRPDTGKQQTRCTLEPLQHFLDGQDARAQTGSLGPPVNANVLCN